MKSRSTMKNIVIQKNNEESVSIVVKKHLNETTTA